MSTEQINDFTPPTDEQLARILEGGTPCIQNDGCKMAETLVFLAQEGRLGPETHISICAKIESQGATPFAQDACKRWLLGNTTSCPAVDLAEGLRSYIPKEMISLDQAVPTLE